MLSNSFRGSLDRIITVFMHMTDFTSVPDTFFVYSCVGVESYVFGIGRLVFAIIAVVVVVVVAV